MQMGYGAILCYRTAKDFPIMLNVMSMRIEPAHHRITATDTLAIVEFGATRWIITPPVLGSEAIRGFVTPVLLFHVHCGSVECGGAAGGLLGRGFAPHAP